MIALALLASHTIGDFVLQTRWQAAGKLDDRRLRLAHVITYCLAFMPVCAAAVLVGGVPQGRAYAFLLLLGVLHFATDSRRFRSTLGDRAVWWLRPVRAYSEHDPSVSLRGERARIAGEDEHGAWTADGYVIERDGPTLWIKFDLPDNPWPALPLAIDQSLHLVQLAALGWLLT